MSSSNAESFEVFSLKVKYEQVCQKESEAITRNLSLKKDFSSMKLKLAASASCEARAQRMKHLKKLKFAYSEWLDNAYSTIPTVSIPSKSFCSTRLSSTQPLMSSAPMSTIIHQHSSSVYQHPSSMLNISPTSYLHPPIFTSSMSTASQPHYTSLSSHSSSHSTLSSSASQPSYIFPTPIHFTPSLLTASPPITHVHSPLSTQSFSAASQIDFSIPSQKNYTPLTSCSYLPLFTSYLSTPSSPTPHSYHNLTSSPSTASLPIPHSHHNLASSLSASPPIPHSHNNLTSFPSTASPHTSHSHHNLTSSLSTASPPIPHSHHNLTFSLSTASSHTSHSHLPLTKHFLSTTVPVEERENVSQQLSLGLSSSRSHPPVLNKSLDSAAPNHPGERELPAVESHAISFLPSLPSMTPSAISSMDQIVASCDNHLPKHSPSCEPLVPCFWSLSIKSENTTETNGKLYDKKIEIPEEDKVKEEEEGDKKEEDEEENNAVVLAEILAKEAEKREVVNQEEEEMVVVSTHKTQPLSIDLNTLDATSGTSLTHSSQEFLQNELDPYALPCSSSHHMSAYLKLVGKCTTKLNSPTSSLTSEGSTNLENYLLDVMEGSTRKGGVESETPFLVGSSLTNNPVDKDRHMEGGESVGGDMARKTSNFTAPLHPKDGRRETRSVIVDSTSLKRRMGLVSSSDDESVVSYGKGNPNNPESPYEQEDEFDFFT